MTSYTLSISVDLQDEEVQRLMLAMWVRQQPLEEALQRLASAATQEWLDQILARRLPPRIRDAREVRLLHYALQVAGGRLPPPEQIGDLFHLTAPESRTLHRNTRTRYAFELEQGVLSALGDAITSGTWVDATGGAKGYMRVHMDQALFEFAELRLARTSTGPAPRITKDDSYDDYRVPLTSFEVLCGLCGMDYEQAVADARTRGGSSRSSRS